ncbi:MAG: peptidylprolyl isomerase, partial [Gammaproteobacteria bacterium]|nr:peptidylprolyl isomerase [Gammaproteobacteria bacterium]
EQRQGRHILIVVDGNEDEAAQLALELRQRIADGEDFGALAKEYSDDPVSAEAGGDLGWANRGDNVAALDEALFELSEGEVSDPVRSEFGYHIVRLDAVSAGSLKTFEEVRDELKEELRLQNAANQYYALAELADDLALENPDSLEPVAEETGLEIKTVETFTRSGGEPFGYDQTLVDTVFSAAVLDDGENSPLIELSNDRALILRVAEYRPSELEPIELVSTRAAERVKLQKAVDLARSRGEEALQRINGGESITVVAEDIGFSVVETGLVSRNVDTIDAELMAAVFRTQAASDDNLSYYGLPLARGGYALYRVDEVVPGQPEAIDQQARDERKRTLAAQTGSGSLGALIADLRDRADVAVAAGLFDSPAEE